MTPGNRLIVVGMATLVAGLVVTFPARIAYQWFAPPDLVLSGISGSVWTGKAVQGSAANFYLSDLSWRFRPLSLFTLKAAFRLAAKPPSGFIEANVAVGPGGGLSFTDLAAAVPLASLNPVLPLTGIEGDLSLQFDRLVIDDGFPTDANGTVGVSNLVVRALSPAALGDYRAVLQTTDAAISGVVEDVSGVLDISGTLVLDRDRKYSFVGKIAANANAPDTILEQLRFLGSPDQQGRREFRFEGSL
ncbi:MAG: type II secretion system protein N [Woeseia sp.]